MGDARGRWGPAPPVRCWSETCRHRSSPFLPLGSAAVQFSSKASSKDTPYRNGGRLDTVVLRGGRQCRRAVDADHSQGGAGVCAATRSREAGTTSTVAPARLAVTAFWGPWGVRWTRSQERRRDEWGRGQAVGPTTVRGRVRSLVVLETAPTLRHEDGVGRDLRYRARDKCRSRKRGCIASAMLNASVQCPSAFAVRIAWASYFARKVDQPNLKEPIPYRLITSVAQVLACDSGCREDRHTTVVLS